MNDAAAEAKYRFPDRFGAQKNVIVAGRAVRGSVDEREDRREQDQEQPADENDCEAGLKRKPSPASDALSGEHAAQWSINLLTHAST
jgi:hypothetical protein